MNIWILHHNAGTYHDMHTRHYDFSRELVAKGHSVTIFASSFKHNKFIEEHLAPHENWKVEVYDGVRFVWIRTFPYKGNEWRRAVDMLVYAWKALLIGNKINEKPEVIIGSSPQPFAALSSLILSRFKKSRFFFEVRDLWPQTLIDLGAISEKSLSAVWMRKMEKLLYQKAEKIITLLPHADKYITQLGIPAEKIFWIPNGADLKRYENIKKYDGGVSNPFKIMYLGAHGRANALDVILDAAKIIQDKNFTNIKFIFVGDGPKKKSLIEYCQNQGIMNVEFRDSVPKDKIFKEIGDADSFVINLEDSPLFKYGISPNKLFDYFASERPILFSVNSSNNPVAEAKAGISVPPRNPEALAKAAIDLANMSPEERIKLGKNGLDYAKKNHDIRLLADKLEKLLLS